MAEGVLLYGIAGDIGSDWRVAGSAYSLYLYILLPEGLEE